jgi:transcriptional regulator with XRE-family HTH domain
MTQKELAEKLGVSSQTISNIEKGEGFPMFKNLEKISILLSANPIQLFGKVKEVVVLDEPIIFDEGFVIDKLKDISGG